LEEVAEGGSAECGQKRPRWLAVFVRSGPPFVHKTRRGFPAFDRDAMIRSGLTFRDVFAQHALIAFDPPLAVRTILKPFGDADLGVNLAIHHRDVGLLAVSNDFFQANLTVA
jgi:hypothetical protein